VPRIAATAGSLLLIVCSIGVNIARYPVVWRIADTARQVAQPDETPPSALPAASSPPSHAQPEKAMAPSPATNTEIAATTTQPAPAEKPASGPRQGKKGKGGAGKQAENRKLPSGKSAEPTETAKMAETDRAEPVGHIVAVRPLASAGSFSAAEDLVRRLPPVDRGDAAGSGLRERPLPEGMTIVYPSTGL
jgi:hypothetical protein